MPVPLARQRSDHRSSRAGIPRGQRRAGPELGQLGAVARGGARSSWLPKVARCSSRATETDAHRRGGPRRVLVESSRRLARASHPRPRILRSRPPRKLPPRRASAARAAGRPRAHPPRPRRPQQQRLRQLGCPASRQRRSALHAASSGRSAGSTAGAPRGRGGPPDPVEVAGLPAEEPAASSAADAPVGVAGSERCLGDRQQQVRRSSRAERAWRPEPAPPPRARRRPVPAAR